MEYFDTKYDGWLMEFSNILDMILDEMIIRLLDEMM